MNNLILFLTFISVLGCGLVAGIFYAFSTFIMSALARLLPAQGIEAMQSINITVLNPLFLGVFIGTAVVCVPLALYSVWLWGQPASVYLLAGSLLYLIGTFLVTVVYNVPMNKALEKAEPTSSESFDLWTVYLAKWTFWNHIRTAAALLASAFFMLALLQH